MCAGNTDRSPLAAGLLQRRLDETLGCSEDELEDRGYQVSSAGLAAEEGQRASRRLRRIARELTPPLDLDEHRARKLTTDLLDKATRVICMERSQRDEILAFFPHRVREILLLDPEGSDIADPAGESMTVYKRLAGRLDAAATLIAGSLVS